MNTSNIPGRDEAPHRQGPHDDQRRIARQMESDQGIEEFIRLHDSKELPELPPVNTAKLMARLCVLDDEVKKWKRVAMEEQRRCAAVSSDFSEFKAFIREEVVNEIYGQNHGAQQLIAKVRAMVSENQGVSDECADTVCAREKLRRQLEFNNCMNDLPNEMRRLVLARICARISGHCPDDISTTDEAVGWLVGRHKAAAEAALKLDEIRTEKLAAKGLGAEASAVSAARVILLKSKRIADGKPERQEENANSIPR